MKLISATRTSVGYALHWGGINNDGEKKCIAVARANEKQRQSASAALKRKEEDERSSSAAADRTGDAAKRLYELKNQAEQLKALAQNPAGAILQRGLDQMQDNTLDRARGNVPLSRNERVNFANERSRELIDASKSNDLSKSVAKESSKEIQRRQNDLLGQLDEIQGKANAIAAPSGSSGGATLDSRWSAKQTAPIPTGDAPNPWADNKAPSAQSDRSSAINPWGDASGSGDRGPTQSAKARAAARTTETLSSADNPWGDSSATPARGATALAMNTANPPSGSKPSADSNGTQNPWDDASSGSGRSESKNKATATAGSQQASQFRDLRSGTVLVIPSGYTLYRTAPGAKLSVIQIAKIDSSLGGDDPATGRCAFAGAGRVIAMCESKRQATSQP